MKKILAFILMAMMVLSLTACGGGSTVTLTQVCDDIDTLSAEVSVGYKDGTVLYQDESSEAELVNEEKDFSIELYLYFDDDRYYFEDDAKEEDSYQEVQYSGFDGYMYQCDEFEYEICLSVGQQDEQEVYLFAYVAPGSNLIDTETTNMEDILNQKDVQDILNSIQFKGIKEIKGE